MSESTDKTPDLSPASMHFQIFLVGTLIFLVALFWCTSMPHTNTHQAYVVVALSRLIAGLRAVGCYLAFASVIFAHKVLRRRVARGPRHGGS